MALTTEQKASFLFKQAQGVAETSVTRDFFEEPRKGPTLVLNDQIWAQSGSIPTTAPTLADGATLGVVQRFIDRTMTAVAGVSNSFYLADLIDAIPFNFGDGSYNYALKDSSGNAISFGQGDWLVENTGGVLTFYGLTPGNMPPKISFYKYVGSKGISGGGSGVTSVNGDFGPAVILTTSNISEGSNLYFTDGRAQTAVVTSDTSGNETNLAPSIAALKIYVASQLSASSVTSVNSLTGAVNLTTTNIAEGTNLYFTDTRAEAAAVIDNTSGNQAKAPSVAAMKTYVAASSPVLSVAGLTGTVLLNTSNVTENPANLYFTNARALSAISTGILTGPLSLGPTGTLSGNGGEARFYELAANGSNYVGFKSPNSVTTNLTWTLPAADGTSGQVLSTNGIGALSWSSVSSPATTVSTKTNSYTLQESDSGSVINMTNTGSASITVPSGLATNFSCKIIRSGGPVKIVPSSTTINSNTLGAICSSTNGKLDLQGCSLNNYNLSGDLNTPLYGCVIDGTVFAQVIVGNFAFIGGSFTTITDRDGNVYSRARIAKIDMINGTIDTTFDPGSGFDNTVYALDYVANSSAVGISDALYVGGDFTIYNSSSFNARITKLNGTTALPDTAFTASANSTVFAIKAHFSAGNALFAAGAFTTYNSTTRQYIVRLNLASGAIDATFDSASGFSAQVKSFVIDGSVIYAGGNFTTYKGSTRQYIAKINALTAALDTTFDSASGFNNFVRVVHRNSFGEIFVGGDFVTYKGTTRQCIAKINATTAALDTTFDSASGFTNSVHCITSVSNTDLFVGGQFTTYKGTTRQRIAKLNANTAALDTTFDTANAFNNVVYAINTSSNNTALNVAGIFTSYKGSTEIKYACKLDTTYGLIFNNYIVMGLKFNNTVSTMVISGNFAYVGGLFTTVTDANGNVFTRGYIAKINYVTGEVDTTFDSASGFDFAVISIVLSGTDLYVGGNFTAYKGTTRQRIAKLNATTAALDATFNSLSGFSSDVQSIALDSSGNLYAGGNFTAYKGTARNRIAKLNATTAALDTTFDSASGFSSTVVVIALDGSGNLYVGGGFGTYKGTARQYIAKINATTAALDTTFNSLSGFDSSVHSIVLSGTDLYVGGNFTAYKGISRQYIAKINATTAALDTTFDSGVGFNGFVYSIVLSGTDLYVGGGFAIYKSNSRECIAKINATTAVLDTTFNTASGFNSNVNSLVLDGSGNLIVGGNFLSYKSNPVANYWGILNSTNASLTSYTVV